MMMPHITQKYKDNLDAARNANHSLAVFIKVEITLCHKAVKTPCVFYVLAIMNIFFSFVV